MPRKKREPVFRQMVGLPSRNRDDILKAIEGEEIPPNDTELDGHHVIWHTTPEELLRFAERAKGYCRGAGKVIFVPGSGGTLLIGRAGSHGSYFHEPAVEIGRFGGQREVTIWIRLSALITAARKLPEAPWERKKKGYVYGSDRRVIKLRVGEDIVTIFWTPPFDQEGVPQISPMQWKAWWRKTEREWAKSVREEEQRTRSNWRDVFPLGPIRSAV